MTDWNIRWAGRNQHYATPDSGDEENPGPKIITGGGATPLRRERPQTPARRRFELSRAELPRGGASLGAQIGAELQAVYVPPDAELRGLDALLARISR